MEWIGWICLMIMIGYSSYPGRVKKLEKKIKKLEKINKPEKLDKLEKVKKGENEMSKIISELVGKKCKIKTEEISFELSESDLECNILDVDEEWIKFSYVDKKKGPKTKIIRIDSIEMVEVIGE